MPLTLQTADTLRTEGNEGNEENGLDPRWKVWALHLLGDRYTPNPAPVTNSFFVIFVNFCPKQLPDQGSQVIIIACPRRSAPKPEATPQMSHTSATIQGKVCNKSRRLAVLAPTELDDAEPERRDCLTRRVT